MVLLAAYMTFGWSLGSTEAPPLTWILASALAILQAGILTIYAHQTGLWISQWLKSDVGYFLTVVSSAFLAAATVVWFDIFAYLLVLGTAGLLARLDTLAATFKDIQAFLLLLFSSETGLAFSWILTHLG